MKKINKKTLILTSIITLIPIIIGIILWSRLPEQIPTHFGMDGTPNGWSSKGFTVFGLPLFLLGVHLLGIGITSQDPKYENMSDKLFTLMLWICPMVSLILVVSCYTSALGYEMNITKYVMVVMGILFVLIGNYLPKCKQNYTMGIKLPWTLADEENWNKTHRLAGFIWVAGGVVIVISSFFKCTWIIGAIALVMVFVPTIYSFLLYKKNK